MIRLVHYVRVPRMVQRKISRRALFARDGWRCVYCGTTGGRLTLDHVIPRSRGGDSSWENVVTSCAPCNLRKGNRLPHEIQMELPARPRPPAPVLFIRLATPKIPNRWERYLAPYTGATGSAPRSRPRSRGSVDRGRLVRRRRARRLARLQRQGPEGESRHRPGEPRPLASCRSRGTEP